MRPLNAAHDVKLTQRFGEILVAFPVSISIGIGQQSCSLGFACWPDLY